MKKNICMLTGLAFMILATACSGNQRSGRGVNGPTGVNEVLESGIAAQTYSQDPNESLRESIAESMNESSGNSSEPACDAVEEGQPGDVDLDLTVLSANVVYTEVYNIMLSPGDYIGKKIRMDGSFALYHDPATDKNYYACIIADATACCSQGIEFVLTDDYTYPDDYPEEGGYICVTGTFGTYEENGYTYCSLIDARLD